METKKLDNTIGYKPNFLIKLITLGMLIGGLFSLASPLLYYSNYSMNEISTNLGGSTPFELNYRDVTILVTQGVILIILAFGLRKMKKWALYLFLGLSTATLVYYLLGYSGGNASGLIGYAIIEVIILIYFFMIRKEFH